MRRLFRTAAVLCATFAAPALRAQQPVTIDFSEYACSEATQPCEYQATTGNPVTSKGFDFLDRYSILATEGTNSLGTWSNNPSNLGYVNRPSNLGSSTALFAPGNGDVLEMYTHSGRNFDLYSMDVAGLFRQSSISPPLGAPTTFNMYFQYFSSYTSWYNGTPDGDLYASVSPGTVVNGDRVPLLRTLDFSQPLGTISNGVYLQWLDGRPSDLQGGGIFGIQWIQGSLSGFDATGAPVFATGSGRAHQFTNVVAAVVPEPGTFALAGAGLALVVGAGLRRRRAA
ncbi:MAG TPA: PEP-CTERM sorting domain-containing protein [Gemmatirosa sp.]